MNTEHIYKNLGISSSDTGDIDNQICVGCAWADCQISSIYTYRAFTLTASTKMTNFIKLLCLLTVSALALAQPLTAREVVQPGNRQEQHRHDVLNPTINYNPYDEGNVTLSAIESEMFSKVNEHRIALRLPPLMLASGVSQQARTHSLQMAEAPVPHVNDLGQKDRFDAIARIIPHLSCKEAVGYVDPYYHPQPITTLFAAWLKNPQKRRLIEGPYNLTGISVERDQYGAYYVTQIFVRR